MYTIIVAKTTYRARPNYPDNQEYGRALKDGACFRNCFYAKGSAKFKRQIFKGITF